jgi:putative oxidoreductase
VIERIQPIAFLIGRVAIGVIFFVHGWDKVFNTGLAGVEKGFAGMGVPLPALSAPAVAALELVGGAALILGALLPVFGVLLAIDMIGAIVFVHGAKGFFTSDGGFEFVLALAAASLMIAFSGGGALAVDNLWYRRHQVPAEPVR